MNHDDKNNVEEALPKYLPKMTPEEYLEWERKEPWHHEYIDGEVITMSFAAPQHAEIQMNLYLAAGTYLKGKKCKMMPAGMKTFIAAGTAYLIPDATIYCQETEMQDEHNDVALNPTVIFEVLSPSTMNYDLTRKLMYYMQLPSLREYITIDSTDMGAQMRWREEKGLWQYEEVSLPESKLLIRSIDFEMSLEELYDGVRLEPVNNS